MNRMSERPKKKKDSRAKLLYNLSVSEPIKPDSIPQTCFLA
jgi:hypothetical protein